MEIAKNERQKAKAAERGGKEGKGEVHGERDDNLPIWL